MRTPIRFPVAALGLVAFAGLAHSQPAVRELKVRVTPSVIEMAAFYSGARVKVEGSVRQGARVAVLIRGGSRAETFNRKIKAGPIWITRGKVKVSGVPTLFLRFTDGMLREFLSREQMDHYQMDQAAVQRQMEIAPDHDHETMVASWLSLKAQDGTYRLVRDGVRMGAPGPDGVPFLVEFDWPRKAPPADYEVSVYECFGRVVTATSTVKLPVVRAGFPDYLSKMARNSSLNYGVAATLAAAVFGFAIDFIVALVFGKKAATAH